VSTDRAGSRRLIGLLSAWSLALALGLACSPTAAQPAARAEPAPAQQPARAAEPAPAARPADAIPTAPLHTLTIAVPGRGVAYLPLVVAEKQGILARYGLTADIRPLRQDAANAALASGDVDT